MQKIFVSDYDHTFSPVEYITGNINSLCKWREQGNLFVFATGRCSYDFQKVVDQYGLSYDYVLLDHGAIVQTERGELIRVSSIDREIISQFITYVKLIEDVSIRVRYVTPFKKDASFVDDQITKIILEFEDMDIMDDIYAKLYQQFKDVLRMYVFSSAIEIVSIDTDKAKALMFLCENFAPENVYVIGDSVNDLPMIQQFQGSCVEGALEEVKRVSKYVYRSVSDYIEDILKEEVQKYTFFVYIVNQCQNFVKK